MKRLVIVLSVFSMIFGLVAFECSSSEMNAAKMYMAQNVKNYAKAKEQLNMELSKNPNNDEAYYLLGKIEGTEGNYKEMVNNFAKSVGISAKFKKEIDAEKAFYLKAAAERGNAFYNRAYKLKGDSSKASYTRALAAFQDAMNIAPDSAFAYENYTYTALNLNKLELLDAPLQKWMKIGKNPKPYWLLARVYLDRGDKAKEAKNDTEAKANYDKAIALLNDGKSKYSSDKDLLETLSNAYIRAGRGEEAKTTFSEGVKAQPNNKVFRYNYGTILLDAKDFKGAEEHLKKAVEIDPNYLEAVYNLAACYVNWGVDLNEKAVQAGQSNSEYKEKIKLALPLINSYLEKKNDDSEMWNILGQAHTALGNKKEAEEAFKKSDQFKK